MTLSLNDQSARAKDLLALLDRDAEEIIGGVCTRLAPYLPADYASNIDVYVLAGGYATGFTLDEGTDFYLAAQRIGDDPAADANKIYSAGFMDDGPLYYVGFYMAREIEREQGAGAIRALLSQPPTAFFQQYQSLCHANKDLLCFSPTTDSIIEHAAGLLR